MKRQLLQSVLNLTLLSIVTCLFVCSCEKEEVPQFEQFESRFNKELESMVKTGELELISTTGTIDNYVVKSAPSTSKLPKYSETYSAFMNIVNRMNGYYNKLMGVNVNLESTYKLTFARNTSIDVADIDVVCYSHHETICGKQISYSIACVAEYENVLDNQAYFIEIQYLTDDYYKLIRILFPVEESHALDLETHVIFY